MAGLANPQEILNPFTPDALIGQVVGLIVGSIGAALTPTTGPGAHLLLEQRPLATCQINLVLRTLHG